MQNRFIIVITEYNVAPYIDKCLSSVLSQSYSHYDVVVVDDCSTDGTWEIVQKYPVMSIRNKERNRLGYVNNLQGIMRASKDENDIIVLVSGDDYLAHDGVLDRLNREYQGDIWMTYGQFVPLSGNYGPYCKPIPDTRTYRKQEDWVTSHLITFKRWLFDRVREDDFMRDGKYMLYAMDRALMYAMIEMSGREHIGFIEDVLYIYNDLNPMCVFRLDPKECIKLAEYVQGLEPYDQL